MIVNYRRQCLIVVSLAGLAGACTPGPPEDLDLGAFDYRTVAWPACDASRRAGPAGRSDDETLDPATKYSVRTPANYNESVRHPLIVVYAPAGHNRFASEAFVGLTPAATRAGFIVTYVDSRRLSLPAIKRLSRVAGAVRKKWCIDGSRVYLTGHSDGGTIANAMAFLPDIPFRPRAIAPSAAGIRAADMSSEECREPLAVMTLQNDDDELFPNYGGEVAAWWARCNACSNETKRINDACHEYIDCAEDGETVICTNPGNHRNWPEFNEKILEFFKRT